MVCLVGWIFILFLLFVPVLKKKIRRTPLDVLQSRLSKGEINVYEYEQRKRFIEKDRDLIAKMFLVQGYLIINE